MPYVSIRLAGKINKDQKADMCKGVTKVICDVTGKPENTVLIFIDECEHENVASGGVLLQKPR